jgi:hypothetical protein
MLNFDNFVARHGEFGVQAIVEGIERREGIRFANGVSLQERWDALMKKTASFDARMAA